MNGADKTSNGFTGGGRSGGSRSGGGGGSSSGGGGGGGFGGGGGGGGGFGGGERGGFGGGERGERGGGQGLEDDKRGGRGGGFGRKRVCRFCAEKSTPNFKDQQTLKYFVTERGKIIPRRISGNCAKHQRQVAVAIKQARGLALIPYVASLA